MGLKKETIKKLKVEECEHEEKEIGEGGRKRGKM